MGATEQPEAIAELIGAYLSEHPQAIAVEDGKVLFDFASARYAATPERGRCLLEIWSEERNVVRRALSAEIKNNILKLSVQRFGQPKPSRLEICAQAERRSPSSLRAMRASYQHLLERSLERIFPGWTLERMTSAADLAHSFGGVCARGLMRRGQERVAVVGCGEGETQSTIDNAAAVAVLWLDHCREHLAGKGHVGSSVLVLPAGRHQAAQLRLAQLDPALAAWRLFALDEQSEEAQECELHDEGNLDSRLVHCFDRRHILERFAASIERMRELCPEAELAAHSTSELGFRYLGLEFARASLEPDQHFRLVERIRFGAPPAEYAWTAESEPMLRQLLARLRETRGGGLRNHPFFRLQSERWLQSVVERDLSLLDSRLDAHLFYPQVPAFLASDRAVIDLLGITREGQLAVIELKADEDLYLPMQGLDYWARVRRHLRRGELNGAGYFAGRELSQRDPVLILAAPALHLHTTTATLLRYFSPQIEWTVVGVDERWREGLRVVFRKRREWSAAAR